MKIEEFKDLKPGEMIVDRANGEKWKVKRRKNCLVVVEPWVKVEKKYLSEDQAFYYERKEIVR